MRARAKARAVTVRASVGRANKRQWQGQGKESWAPKARAKEPGSKGVKAREPGSEGKSERAGW